MASWKRWMFSISWKFVPLAWIFLIDPGWILFIRLQSTTPFFRMSSRSPLGTGSPITEKIQLRTSDSNSLLRGYKTFWIYNSGTLSKEVAVISRNISFVNVLFLDYCWFIGFGFMFLTFLIDSRNCCSRRIRLSL